MMSPEQRVDAAILRWAMPKPEHLGLTAEQRVAEAKRELIELVRQAENDALERAAVAAEAKGDRWGTMRDDLYNEGCQDAAKAIRSLKHED